MVSGTLARICYLTWSFKGPCFDVRFGGLSGLGLRSVVNMYASTCEDDLLATV